MRAGLPWAMGLSSPRRAYGEFTIGTSELEPRFATGGARRQYGVVFSNSR